AASRIGTYATCPAPTRTADVSKGWLIPVAAHLESFAGPVTTDSAAMAAPAFGPGRGSSEIRAMDHRTAAFRAASTSTVSALLLSRAAIALGIAIPASPPAARASAFPSPSTQPTAGYVTAVAARAPIAGMDMNASG